MHWKNLRRTRSLSTTEMTATGLGGATTGGGGGGHYHQPHHASATTVATVTASTSVTNSTSTIVGDGTVLLALTKWSDEGSDYLSDFIQNHPLPQVARVVKGRYLTLGAPTALPTPHAAPHQTVFLCSYGKHLNITAQCIKFKEGSKKVVPVGPKLVVPENYEGLFEILSEEGRAVRCLETVADLADRFPDSCLVRESVKAYVSRNDDAEIITDKMRNIAAGETLVLISEVFGSSTNPKVLEKGAARASSGRFLRCFDARGASVYLSFEQRGKFSIIAKEENISGVHTIKNLLTKRFPMMVRLVSGKPLAGLGAGGFPGGKHGNELRLYASYEEDIVMALPLGSRDPQPIMAVPLKGAALKLQPAKNAELLSQSREHGRLVDTCKVLLEEYLKTIRVCDDKHGHDPKASVDAQLAVAANTRRLPYFRRAFSEPYGYRMSGGVGAVSGGDTPEVNLPDKNDTRYDEIDQIYDYVRGFAPLPKSSAAAVILDTTVDEAESAEPKSITATAKPDPPPIETIPARRAQLLQQQHPDLIQFHHHHHHHHPTTSAAPAPPTTTATPVTVHPKVSHKMASLSTVVPGENIYERIPRKGELIPPEMHLMGLVPSTKKSSGPRAYYVHSRASKNKIYIKSAAALNRNNNNNYNNNINNNSSSAGVGHLKTSRFFRYHGHAKPLHVASSSPAVSAAITPALVNPATTKEIPRTVRSVKSLTTSPIFNIRYKSLTNLALDFNTLDSSNSGGQISASSGGGGGGGVVGGTGGGGSGGSYIIESSDNNNKRGSAGGGAKRLQAMSRPKSLTNLVCEFNNHLLDYNRANILNSAICRLDPRRHSNESSQSTSKESEKEKLSSPNITRTKRLGTLYL